jgi:hypothetical protein
MPTALFCILFLQGTRQHVMMRYLHGLPGKRPRITGYRRIRVLRSTAVSWVQPRDYISSIISIIILLLSDYVIILLLYYYIMILGNSIVIIDLLLLY